MNQRSLYLFTFSCLFLVSNLTWAQLPRLKFTHLGPEDGLSHTRVWSALQDRQGFLWFATDYGLNKYDGYKFTVYKNNERDSNTIADNFIWKIALDKNGNLWIGTNGGGLDFFDLKTETIIHHKHKPRNNNSIIDNEVRSVYVDKKGLVWLGCGINGGLIDCYDPQSRKFTHYKLPFKDKSDAQRRVSYITEDPQGNIWFGLSSGGIYVYHPTTHQYDSYLHQNDKANSLPTGTLNSISFEGKQKAWICTASALCSLDIPTGEITTYHNDSNDDQRHYEYGREDENGNIWLSTNYGLSIFNKKRQTFTNLQTDPNNSNSLIGNNIGHLFIDNTGIIWANVLGKGIDKINTKAYKFRHYKHDDADPFSITDNFVRGFHFDKQNNLWLSMMNHGVDKLEQNKKTAHFDGNTKNKNALNENPVNTAYCDSYGSIWIGNQNYGLNRLDYNAKTKTYETSRYRCESRDAGKYPFSSVKAIIEDRAGRLWIGSEIGIDRYDREHNSFIHYSADKNNPYALSDGRIQFFFIDSKGYFWIGTWDGLMRSSIPTQQWGQNKNAALKTEKFISIKKDANDSTSISSNKLISVCEGKDGSLWFGSYGDGLNSLSPSEAYGKDPQKIKFKHYNELNGLPNNVIYGVQCDEDNNIWISTNKGLARLDPKTQKTTVYTEKDGLQSDRFFWGAYGKSKTGELYFGGLNGYNAFYQNEIKNSSYAPRTIITNLKINNEQVLVNTPKAPSPLLENINTCRELVLSYLENSFSFEFTALDYTAPENNQYAYQLEGFDKNWIHTDSKKRFANYTNIDAGTYFFKIKATNSDGVWNKNETRIKITIKPPFWFTWWFELLFVLIVGSSIFGMIRYRINKLKQQQIHLEKIVAKRTQEIKQKNLALEQQKEEIIAQRDELDQKNRKIEAQTDQIKGSIRYAKSIQSASFPPKEQIDKYFDSFIIYRPKDIVSGDFYWFNHLNIKTSEGEEKSYIFAAVVDCTGHGVPGAFMSMLGSSLLKEIVLQRHIVEPAQILTELETEVNHSLHQGTTNNTDGMDICFCRIERKKEEAFEIAFAGAKRPLLYFDQKKNTLQKIRGTRKSIGGHRENTHKLEFESTTIHLNKGDKIFLSSDGYQDQPNADRKRIGSGKLEEILSENGRNTPSEIKLSLDFFIEELLKDTEQRDDITIIGIELQ